VVPLPRFAGADGDRRARPLAAADQQLSKLNNNEPSRAAKMLTALTD